MKTILVVDDEVDIRDTVCTVLESNGYRVVHAVNADDCLKKLPKAKPDLILLDIMMPGTPVRKILDSLRGTKVSFLSAVRLSESEKEELLKGKNMVDFLEKPFDIKALLSHVAKATK